MFSAASGGHPSDIVRKAATLMVEAPHSATTHLLIDGYTEDREYWAQRLLISLPDSVVLQAATGAEGVAICRSQRVDCVITELTLPDMSGFEVLVKLVPRAYRPEMPVIILSRTML